MCYYITNVLQSAAVFVTPDLRLHERYVKDVKFTLPEIEIQFHKKQICIRKK